MPEPLPNTCPACGRTVSAGNACKYCAGSTRFQFVHREMVLLILLAFAAASLYFAVRAFAGSNRALKMSDAAYWYNQGDEQLRQHHADAAVAAFRKAFVAEPNRIYARALAQALDADGRDAEAREILLEERDSAPEDAEINLDLARIAAKEHDVPETVHYYHNALYGVWSGQNIELQRRRARGELIEFLIAQHAREQTLAELLALAGDLPNTVTARIELGGLFLQNGDPEHALNNFKLALVTQPQNQVALEGAGKAAFELADYGQARRDLWLLVNPDDKAKQMLNTATLVVQNDPMELHLTYARRTQRLLADFQQTSRQLRKCLAERPESPEAEALQSLANTATNLKRKLQSARQREQPELAYSTLKFVAEADEAISRSCGPLQDLDAALLLVAQKSRGAEQ